jgi:hypothetical protein
MNENGIIAVLVGLTLLSAVIGSCNNSESTVQVQSPQPRNNYQDMRNRGHSEEDAIIFSILKQQGHSDYDALNATKSSKR